MAEPIKQTLFRFRTMRAPELLSADAKTNYFIQHTDGTSGPFYAAVAGKLPAETNQEVLATAAAAFSFKTKAQVVAIDSGLYDLGLLLLKKKNKITVAEATTAVTGLTALTSVQLLDLWDNLFYQTITLESGYTREAILLLLVGNHFVTNFSSIPSTDADMQRWANSRVVMPVELFDVEPSMDGATTNNETATGLDILNLYKDAAMSSTTIEQINVLKEEILIYKSDFVKTNNALEKAAIETQISGVETALASATRTPVVDQFTNFTFDVLSNYNPPVYSYSRPDEVDYDVMRLVLSEESDFIMQKYDLYKTVSFEELEIALDEIATNLTSSIFKGSSFYQEKIAVDGTLISKCSIDHRFGKKHSYTLDLFERSAKNYIIIMTLDLRSTCLTLDNATTSADIPESSTYTAKKYSNSKGIVTIDLTDGVPINFGVSTKINLSTDVTFNNGLKLSFSTLPLNIGSQVSGFLTESFPANSDPDVIIPSGYGVKRLGIADYRKLEQTLCCYVPGEVSHIENVMAREYKERSTRRMRKEENTTTSSSSTERENMTDTSTTTRFDMQKEISSILSETRDWSRNSGFSTTSNGQTNVPLVGSVDFTLNTDFSTDISTSNSQEDSNSQSTSFAQDVTEKALSRVVSNVSEERTRTIIEEFEEKNQHGFDNRQGAEHISGVFRWVDKVYKNEIHNYGKRLQYEFMIPEPAEFHLLAKASGASSGNDIPLVKPLDPRTNAFGSLSPIRNSAHILETNYHQWAAVYGATVLPPPKKTITLGKTLLRPNDGSPWYDSIVVKDEIVIPDGYGIDNIYVSLGGNKMEDWSYFLASAAGYTRKYYEEKISKWLFTDSITNSEMRWIHTSIPISAQFTGHQGGMVSFSVKLHRKHVLMEEWQLDTFNAIMSAYEDRLQEYKDALAELEAKQGILMTDNPAYYRRIENTVLKKSCISYLAGFNYLGQDHTVGSEMTNNQVNLTAAMDKYTAAVKFFEQAFEWELMDYHFYPFYWADKDKWEELYSTDNDDALFRAFLRSGMARTILSVRPGFEEAVMYYMSTGLIWNGGEVPVLGDDLYLSIIDELIDPEYVLDETWESRVPSTLTLIQDKTIALDANGLPCYCDTETPPAEDIIVPAIDPLTGLVVYVPPVV